jgi:hypothetical protein
MVTDEEGHMDDDAALISRLARCAAALYRDVPRQGESVAFHAAEIAHAADLELLAASLDAGADLDLDSVLRPGDIRAVCQLLLDVRRQPRLVSPAELQVARAHYPEVDDDSIEPLERLISYYTRLLRGL